MMKKILISLSIMLIALFSGCGSNSSSSSSSNNSNSNSGDDPVITPLTDTTMTRGNSYVMTTSGVITKTSTDANISIETNLNTNETIAKLISGGATCTGCTKQ
jgi:ABC-type Fe3+-hydroxamate transport system substrate-binding protein